MVISCRNATDGTASQPAPNARANTASIGLVQDLWRFLYSKCLLLWPGTAPRRAYRTAWWEQQSAPHSFTNVASTWLQHPPFPTPVSKELKEPRRLVRLSHCPRLRLHDGLVLAEPQVLTRSAPRPNLSGCGFAHVQQWLIVLLCSSLHHLCCHCPDGRIGYV